jgi:hypothetical protein
MNSVVDIRRYITPNYNKTSRNDRISNIFLKLGVCVSPFYCEYFLQKKMVGC